MSPRSARSFHWCLTGKVKRPKGEPSNSPSKKWTWLPWLCSRAPSSRRSRGKVIAASRAQPRPRTAQPSARTLPLVVMTRKWAGVVHRLAWRSTISASRSVEVRDRLHACRRPHVEPVAVVLPLLVVRRLAVADLEEHVAAAAVVAQARAPAARAGAERPEQRVTILRRQARHQNHTKSIRVQLTSSPRAHRNCR